MTAYVFPGQGAQFEGMGKDIYNSSPPAKKLFDQANEILGYRITDLMFEGNAEDLKKTRITQPAIFLHSIITAKLNGNGFKPDAVAGHSLGEFSALVAAGAISFEDGLTLVRQRAFAMQKACEMVEGTMAAILGIDDEIVENICAQIDEVVVPANYNSPGQLVISGSMKGVEQAIQKLTEAGAKRCIPLEVGGAFHSPLMQPAKLELQTALENTAFNQPLCPVYQNINAKAETDPEVIKNNLIAQLTAPVLWTQTVRNMLADGVKSFVEVGGNGKVLKGLIIKVDRHIPVEAL